MSIFSSSEVCPVNVSCVLFDLDGTVLDTLADLRNGVNYALRLFSFPEISLEDTRRFLGNGARQLISLSVPAGTPPEVTEQVLAAYVPYYQAHCRIETAPYPGIPELIAALRQRGIKVGIVSNKPDAAVQELSALFFPSQLDVSIGESPAVRRKPAPDTVFAALRALGREDASSCVYVGDTEVDIETARSAGMPCISVSYGFRTEEELRASGAETLARSVSELSGLLLGA